MTITLKQWLKKQNLQNTKISKYLDERKEAFLYPKLTYNH